MLMQLDTYQFSIATAAYDQLQQQSHVRIARIPLLGGGETLQFVGKNHDIITLTGTVYPQAALYVDGNVGTKAIDDLRRLLEGQKPYLLQSADGNNLGYWVIHSLTNINSNYLGNTPRIQQFQLTIQYYGESPE